MLDLPLPPPRELPPRTYRNLYFLDVRCIVGFILALDGLIFMLISFFVDVPDSSFSFIFGGIGAIIFVVGFVLLLSCIQDKGKLVRALREGQSTTGKITDLTEKTTVRVNGRHAWVVHYEFSSLGQIVIGKTQTIGDISSLKIGESIPVIYDDNDPNINTAWGVW